MNAVAENLKAIRSKAGYTQDELAAELHVTRQTISSYETGRSEPDIETLTKLSSLLDVEVSELIGGSKKPVYQTMQKKYVIWSVVLAIVVLAGIVSGLRLYPVLYAYAKRYYTLLRVQIFLTSVVPVSFAAAGALVPCVLSLWRDTSIRKPWRYLLLALGVCVLVPSIGTALQLLIWGEGVTNDTVWFPFVLWLGREVYIMILPFLGGAFLFLGLNRGKEDLLQE
jgi:transcriptional regulator with XRE-family HTH domain